MTETAGEKTSFIKLYNAYSEGRGNLCWGQSSMGRKYTLTDYKLGAYAFTVTKTIRNFQYLGTSYMHTILLSSLGWGLISSAGSTVLLLIMVEQGIINTDKRAGSSI
eukprot:14676176-Ditylum_brightwellii.AAC.1